MKPLPHQIKAAKELKKKLNKYKVALLAGMTRSGKSLAFLLVLKDYKNPVVITTKNAIPDIIAQAKAIGADHITVTNYHQAHKLSNDHDIFCIDEAHRYIAPAKPKPSQIWKNIKPLTTNKPMIFASGTPSPETYANLYHMFALSDFSPWKRYSRFTEWFNDGYGKPYSIRINNINIAQYDRTNHKRILKEIEPYIVRITRKEAGHKHEAEDHPVTIPLSKKQKKLYKKLNKDRVIPKLNILADTPTKLLQKLHQISGGFIINEDEELIELKRKPKVEWLHENIDPNNTIILSYYKAEQEYLSKHFPHTGSITKNAEGVDYSHFDTMVIYSMSFSAAVYQQVRARQMNINRKKPIKIIYLLSGIDEYVYQAVQQKKNFTSRWYNAAS